MLLAEQRTILDFIYKKQKNHKAIMFVKLVRKHPDAIFSALNDLVRQKHPQGRIRENPHYNPL